MAQASDTAAWDYEHWAGTVDDLAQAARLCLRRIESVAPFPEGYDPEDQRQQYRADKHEAWLAATRARKVEIGVVEADGFTRELTDIDDLATIRPDRLKDIEKIEINVGGNGFIPPSAAISASDWRGLDVRLCGYDRTWTAGLRHEVEDVLKPKERLRPWFLPGFSVPWGALAASATAFWVLALSLSLYFRSHRLTGAVRPR